MEDKTSNKNRRQRDVHVVSSGRRRDNPATGLPQPPTKPKPKGAPAAPPKPKRKPQEYKSEEAGWSRLDQPKAKSKGEQHIAQRKRDKAARDKARAKKAKGLTPQDVKDDKSLNATEKKRILKILEQSKGIGEG